MEVLANLFGIILIGIMLLFFWPFILGLIFAVILFHIAERIEETFMRRSYIFIAGVAFLSGLFGQIPWFYHL